jgi:hypothetical protein
MSGLSMKFKNNGKTAEKSLIRVRPKEKSCNPSGLQLIIICGGDAGI